MAWFCFLLSKSLILKGEGAGGFGPLTWRPQAHAWGHSPQQSQPPEPSQGGENARSAFQQQFLLLSNWNAGGKAEVQRTSQSGRLGTGHSEKKLGSISPVLQLWNQH